MKLPASLHTRLVLSHLLVCLVSIVLILAYAGNTILRSAQEGLEASLEDLAFASSNALEHPLRELNEGRGDIDQVQRSILRLLANHPELQYTIYLPDGSPILSSSEGLPSKADPANAPEVFDALQSEIGEGESIHPNEQGEEMLYVTARIQSEDQVMAVLRLGTEVSPALMSARRSLALLLWIGIVVAIGGSLIGWFLAKNMARPIQRLTQTAERLARGDLRARVNPAGPQELHRLAQVFNIMAGRLQDQLEELRTFVANASHELRTPLTVVKLRTEALRDGALNEPVVAKKFLTDIESEVDRLSSLVNDMLDLSRIESGLASSQRSLLNLSLIVTEVYETFKIRASRAGLNLDLKIGPGIPSVMGNEDQLRRVLYNFVENAIKYTPSGGQVGLSLETGKKGRSVRLLVQDTGPGIPPEHLSHIFERFYRVEATRPRFGASKGSGLGLAIAKSIVEHHGGKIGVSSQLGKGTTFWAELPTQA